MEEEEMEETSEEEEEEENKEEEEEKMGKRGKKEEKELRERRGREWGGGGRGEGEKKGGRGRGGFSLKNPTIIWQKAVTFTVIEHQAPIRNPHSPSPLNPYCYSTCAQKHTAATQQK